jgi:hypothetical protein
VRACALARAQCNKYRLRMLPKTTSFKRLKSAKRFTNFGVDKESYKQELVKFRSVSGRLSFFFNMRTRVKILTLITQKI